MQNRITAVLTDADKTAVLTAMDQIKTKMPFLITTPVGQTAKRTMGAKSVEYVNLCLEGAKNFPGKLTVDFDTEEFDKDVSLINQLWTIRIQLAALLESVDDTMNTASGEAMRSADEVYGLLKAAAKKDGTVKELVDRISQRFSGQGKVKVSL